MRSSATFIPPPQFDPDLGNDAVQGVPDDLGVGMSNDDVPLALIARRGRLAHFRKPGLDD